MRDIPMFTTENGVGTLILKEIPYCANGYVQVLDATDVENFLQECYDFCKMAGAKNVYIAGKNIPDKYPLYTEIWQMECPICKLEKTDAILVPVDATNANKWRGIYNDRMADVPTAAFMSGAKAEELCNKGNAYFVYRDQTLLGIGAIKENRIDCIASIISGAGKDVLFALCAALPGDTAELEVASENKRAVTFYRKYGFEMVNTKGKWLKFTP